MLSLKRLRQHRMSALKLGTVFVVLAVVAGVILFQKNRVVTTLTPGTTIPVEFSQNYKLQQFVSKVKVAGVEVGTVTSMKKKAPNGPTEVQVKVSDDVPAKLGTAPSGEIRPATFLGGSYYVALKPGGAPGSFRGAIPRFRTRTPVELGQVASALQPDARRGLQSTVGNLQGTLGNGGSQELKSLAKDAPGTLDPAGRVFQGLRGTDSNTDLPNLVHGLDNTTQVLADQQVHLNGIVGNLRSTADVLGRRSGDMAKALDRMPATLDSTDKGLDDLHGTIGKVRNTAEPARPAVRELNSTLQHLDPVLVKAHPEIAKMRDVLTQARPVVSDLTPTSQRLNGVLDNVRGPVLDRVNGPILNTVNSPYKGTGRYEGTGSPRPFYQELAFMGANMDRATETTDKNGAMISFEAGVGPGTVAGQPLSLEQLFQRLAHQQEGGQ